MTLLMILSIIIAIYLFVRLVLPSSFSWPIKIVFTLILGLISQKFTFYRSITGSVFDGGLPFNLLFVWETAYLIFIFLAMLVLIRDLFQLCLWILSKLGLSWRIPFSYAKQSLILLVMASCLSSYGLWQAIKVPNVKTVTINIENLPKELDGFSIVQLTDTHLGQLLTKPWLEAVVAKTNALNPDIIVHTGDFIDGSVENLQDMVSPFADLKAKYGVYAVMGNHEYYFNMHEWDKELQRLGFDMLNNEHRFINIEDASLVLVGVTDLAAARFGDEMPNINKAMPSHTEYDAQNAVHVLLYHQPKNAFENPNIDLQLSGHTHGGNFFPIDRLVKYANNGFIRGLYEKGDQKLYLSPGTGLWTGFASRIGVPSEITQLILRPKN